MSGFGSTCSVRLLFSHLAAVVAVGKWESRAVFGISKRGGESLFLDFSTERLFNSLLCCRLADRCALAGIAPQPARPVGDAERSVQMLVHGDVAAGQGAAPAYLVDLQGEVLKADGVVAPHGALE